MNILITGVTSGIGLSLMEEFAELGHNVIGCSRNLSKLNNIHLPNINNHMLSAVDISDDLLVKTWCNKVYEKYDKLDIIINNAGTKSKLLPTWELSAEDYDKTIKTNVLGTINVIRHFVPKMLESNSGIIVNLTSEWGKYADAYVSSYCVSKFAVEALTQSLAKELPKGFMTFALNPYFVRTELLESCKSLFLPGEYELSILPKEWAKFSAPKILKISENFNGKSVTIHPNKSEV